MSEAPLEWIAKRRLQRGARVLTTSALAQSWIVPRRDGGQLQGSVITLSTRALLRVGRPVGRFQARAVRKFHLGASAPGQAA